MAVVTVRMSARFANMASESEAWMLLSGVRDLNLGLGGSSALYIPARLSSLVRHPYRS